MLGHDVGMRIAQFGLASVSLFKQVVTATWIVFFLVIASVGTAQVADRNAVSGPCGIADLEEAQVVLGVPTKPRWHHRWTSKTEVRNACDFMTEADPSTVLRIIKIEFANESLAREYLMSLANEPPSPQGTADDIRGWYRGMSAEVTGRKANVVVSLSVFSAHRSDAADSQASEAQFKRLLRPRQLMLSRM